MSDKTFGIVILSIIAVITITLVYFSFVRKLKLLEYETDDWDPEEESFGEIKKFEWVSKFRKNTRILRFAFNVIIYFVSSLYIIRALTGGACALELMGRKVFTIDLGNLRPLAKFYVEQLSVDAVIICLLCLAKHAAIMKHIAKSSKYNDEKREFLKDFYSLKLKD